VLLFGGAGANQYAVTDLTIADGNVAAPGAGILIADHDDTLTVTRATIRNNFANKGGGIAIYNGTLQLSESALIDNDVDFDGSGMLMNNAQVTLTNVTVSGGALGSSAVSNQAEGGTSTLTIKYSTITNSSGDGISIVAALSGVATTLYEAAIVSNNSGSNFFTYPGDGVATLTSLGHNIADDGTGDLIAVGDQPNTDPLIAPLADNGGTTLTHALLSGSPAIDNAPSAMCPSTDQRGFPRNDGNCDVGAHELGANLIFANGFESPVIR
jgi:hypothetical protein